MNPKFSLGETFGLTDEQKRQLFVALVTFVLAVAAVFGYDYSTIQPRERQLTQTELATSAGQVGVRSVPYNVSALPVRCKKGGINCLEVWNGSDISLYADAGATRTFFVDGETGDLTSSGTLTVTNLVSQTVDFDTQGTFSVAAPTDVATATPAAVINNLGVSRLLELQQGGTAKFSVDGSGNMTIGGNVSGSNWVKIAAPTTIATATPALVVNSLGVSRLVELQKNATPVASIDGSGNASFAGTLEVTGAQTFTGATTHSADVTISPDATGGNQGAKNELSGLPRLKFVALGAGTNGTTETTSYIDDSPTGEFAPIDADVTEAEGSTDSIFKFGASSYKAAFAASAAAGDGFKATITSDNLEANESIGCWLYPSVSIASGDLQILLTDNGGERDFNIGGLTANKWNWVEMDISSLAAGTGDAVTEFGISLTSQGATALGAFSLHADQCFKWDATDEEALSTAILQDGVINVIAVATAAASANTPSVLAEGTDYFVHYESGNDFIVWITDQSANSNLALVAY